MVTLAIGTCPSRGVDDAPDVSAIPPLHRRRFRLMRAQPGRQGSAERRLRPRVALLVDSSQQAREDLLRLALVPRGLSEVVRFARHRVDTRVHKDLERVPTAADVTARARRLSAGPGHG